MTTPQNTPDIVERLRQQHAAIYRNPSGLLTEAADEIASLRQRVAELHRQLEEAAECGQRHASQRDAALEALRPFAALADHYDSKYGNRPNLPEHTIYEVSTHGIGTHELTVGHLRNARAVLASTSPSTLRQRERAVIEAARELVREGRYVPVESCPVDASGAIRSGTGNRLASALAALDAKGDTE